MRKPSEHLKSHYWELETDKMMPRHTRLAYKDLLLRSIIVALEEEEEKGGKMKELIAALEEKKEIAYEDFQKTGDRLFLGRYLGFTEAVQALVDELDRKEEEEAEVKIN